MSNMGTAVQVYSGPVLTPLYGKKALEQAINLAASSVFAHGTILGAVTSSANDVQTLTATGTPTGGTFTYVVTNPLTGLTSNLVVPFNATASSLLTLALAIFGTGNVTTGGGAWPGTPLTITGAGALAKTPIPVAVASTNAFTGGSSPAATVAHTTVGRSIATYAAYASANSDGTQVPKCILKYDCATDAYGNISLAGSAGAGEWGIARAETPAYFSGYFRGTDLIGLDSNALGLTPSRFILINGALNDPTAQVELV